MSSVSVVIPCYRYGRYLEEAVGSVLNDQPGVDVRVLVIDDASPDDSAEVAAKLAARDRRVEVRVHEVNQGNIATFNEGLMEWADADYCLLMSADDRQVPGALRRACDLFDAHPEVGFVYGRSLWFSDGVEPRTPRTRVNGSSIWPGPSWVERRFRQAENPITSPEIIVRTSLQHRVGGYDPGLPRAADMEMYLRLAAHAHVGFLRGVDQAFYRVHAENMSKGVSTLADLRQRRSVFGLVLERYGDRLSDVRRLSLIVHRQLGREALWAAGRVHARGRFRRGELGRRLLGAGRGEVEQDVAALLAFAADCWPAVRREALYRRVASGCPLGPRETAYLMRSKGEWWLRRRSWAYRGV